MKLIKIRRFILTPSSVKLTLIEVIIISLYVRILIATLPFEDLASLMGSEGVVDHNPLNFVELEKVKLVSSSIKNSQKIKCFTTSCYVQSLTGKIMLKRRKIRSTLFLGFRKDCSGKYLGHSWLKSGVYVVSVGNNLTIYDIHSYFT